MISENDLKAIFGRALRKARKDKDLTQEELAAEANMDRSYVSLLERGINQPSFIIIYKICDGLDLDLNELMVYVDKELSTAR
ncbi:MAG: helix-turn-helix transcriptional regulator [Gammaproteobacteria bacterium]|nr:helix-turn-helix transcriptional regulator [Gammaproteobacteria bacterium]